MDSLDDSGLILSEDFDYSYDGSLNIDYEIQTSTKGWLTVMLINSAWAPINILADYSSIILISILARIVHIIIDCSPLRYKESLKHSATIGLGLYQINSYLGKVGISDQISLLNCAPILFLAISSVTRNRYLLVAIALLPVIFNEYLIFVKAEERYCYLRGPLMTLTMKLLSLASWQIQSRNTDLKITNLQSQAAYLMHPASSVVGLWHKPGCAKLNAQFSDQFSTLICRTLKDLIKAFALLTGPIIISDAREFLKRAPVPESAKYCLLVYLVALEFRLTHYFACHLAASLLNMFPEYWPQGKPVIACDIMRVEWPRSLVDVVTMWSIPMHQWLKEAVFRPIRRTTKSTAAAILATYLLSSSLHGFKFHIWSVLLSLGALTYLEHRLRMNLAERLDACILAQPCYYIAINEQQDAECTKGHSSTPYNSALVKVINITFRLLVMAQLAYLGSIFVGNTDRASYREVLKIWHGQYFFGHVLGLLTLCISSIAR